MTKAQAAKIKQLTPLLEVIRAKCLDCSAGSSYEVQKCPCTDCPNFPYRFGVIDSKQNFTREKSQNKDKNGLYGGM